MDVLNIKYGAPTFDKNGNVSALHGIITVGDRVVWLGRKVGGCSDGKHFIVGETYTVAGIYPSNLDLLLQGEKDEHTTRAGQSEYKLMGRG
jgi:hypothetical protein